MIAASSKNSAFRILPILQILPGLWSIGVYQPKAGYIYIGIFEREKVDSLNILKWQMIKKLFSCYIYNYVIMKIELFLLKYSDNLPRSW